MLKYFKGSYIFTIVGLILVYFWSHYSTPGFEVKAIFIALVLSILEISLSFDNAVVNATKLEKMSPIWQKRFLTWGIAIAVFGMRLLFPLLIVSIFANLGILDVAKIAINNPDEYAHYLHISHPSVITFGATFLMMLFFTYFLNPKKDVHWIKPIEEKMAILGSIKGLNVALVLIILSITHKFCENKYEVVMAGLAGIIVYLLVDGISSALEEYSQKKAQIANCMPRFNFVNSCFVNFLYLELIDASFSLDGVLGAFALSKDVVVIAIGLSIGAMFVRSLTIMFVEKKTLKQFKYLEHGAHFAIGALALIMFISAFKEISEIITGFVGLVFIIAAFICSIKEQKKIEN